MQSQAQKIVITVENLAPKNGGSLAPVWFGFHNGKFDSFDKGKKVSAGIESLAEDGSTATITQEFTDKGFGKVQGTVLGSLGGDFAPGQVVQTKISVDGDDASSRYFSYGSMILPSNDQFIANEKAREYQIFDEKGRFIGAELTIDARDAWDAGTEVNDEIPKNTAFFGQTVPNTGVDENGVVTEAPGFLPKGSGGILDDPRFANADFTAPNYQIASIRIANLVEGSKESDILSGTAAPDDIYAGGGDNFVYAKNGNDRIYAKGGNDYLVGGKGDDLIDAGNGDNKIHGNKGDDLLNSGKGNDIIFGGLGDDLISSGAGNDLIYGGVGDDLINSGIGYDTVFVGGGKDQVFLNAGKGTIEIYGFDRNDTFSLGEGLKERDILSIKTFGSDTQIYNGDDLLATVNGIRLNDLTIV
jgi:Ca2+-binding RTX toxin-like protein